MNASQQKIVQYLNEAHASEQALTRVLQSQISMTPRGDYRDGLEAHLRETRGHAARVADRLEQLGQGGSPISFVIGLAETVIGQALALTKTPLDLVRGSGGEEKVLKNAKDTCATEALEIATYTALEQLARSLGDAETAKLAASIRADEEKMLARVMELLPQLAADVVGADVHGESSYDVTKTGAADTVRDITDKAKSTARTARKVPGVARVEGEVKGAAASAGDLAIARYDALNADEITSKLTDLSQIDLAKVDAYERKNDNRSTILGRIDTLRGDEPWTGYDELTASEVQTALSTGDDDLATTVRSYERSHKNRTGVLNAVDRELARN